MNNWITRLLSFGRKDKIPDSNKGVVSSIPQFQPFTKADFRKEVNDKEFLQNFFSPMCCLVGNVVTEHFWGEEKEIKYGLKQLSPNAKVYCFPPLWGDGYEHIQVVGRHRKSKKYITIIIKSRYVTNWRLKWIHSPEVIRRFGDRKWNNFIHIQQMISSLAENR